MNKIYAVYGAAGCGRSLMPIARELIATGETIYFIDDALTIEQQINGYKAVNYDMFKAIESDEKNVLIAIANSNIRQKLAEKLTNDGINIWTVKSQSTVIMDNVIIGNGAALSPFVTIGANAIIGQCFHANLYSYVEHQSLWLDMKILLKTVKKVIIKDGISAEGEATMTKFTGTKFTGTVHE